MGDGQVKDCLLGYEMICLEHTVDDLWNVSIVIFRVRNPSGYIKGFVPSCMGYLSEDIVDSPTPIKVKLQTNKRERKTSGSTLHRLE